MPRSTSTESKETPMSLRARALSSKESNKNEGEVGEASFRVYYGATGAAVPFMWESQPGTPKHPMFDKSNDNTVPPLTPPPSYTSSSSSTSSSSFRKARKSSSWILSAFSFSSGSRSMTSSHVTPTSSLSSFSSGHIRSWSTSSSSSSSASLSSPGMQGRKKQVSTCHRRSASSGSLCFSGQKSPPLLEVEDDMAVGSASPPASTMCFGFGKKQGSSNPMEDANKTILSI